MSEKRVERISRKCRIIDKIICLKDGVSMPNEGGGSGLGAHDAHGTHEALGALGAEDVAVLKLEWPGNSYPGCFFQLQPNSEFLRRPISLAWSGVEDGIPYIALAIRGAGSGTIELINREIGDSIDCFGPLGRGFELPEAGSDQNLGRYLVVGGGIGVAPLLPVVKRLSESAEVDFVVGFKGEPYFFESADYVCTEGGDAAVKRALECCRASGREDIEVSGGMVTPVVRRLLSQNKYEDVFICGPEVMLHALGREMLGMGIDPQLLTEAHFACGVGACLCCSVETSEPRNGQKYARVCKDGPMFRASELGAINGGCKAAPNAFKASKNVAVHSAEAFHNRDHNREGGPDTEDDALAVDLGPLRLKSLLTMASGTFGFGSEYDEFFDIGVLGAVSVKGLTYNPKDGNPGQRVLEAPSGMINSVGLQNPGVRAFLENELEFLRGKDIAVIANINAESVDGYVKIAEAVDAHVDAVELNISCPNVSGGGMAFGSSETATREVVSAVRRAVKKPLIVKLTPNVTDISEIAHICEAEGADVLSLINTVTGLLFDPRTGRLPLERAFGGMSGPAVRAIALKAIYSVKSRCGLPILGMGGIASARDVLDFLRAGASAVAIGTAIFRDPLLPKKIDEDLRAEVKRRGAKNILELV